MRECVIVEHKCIIPRITGLSSLRYRMMQAI